MTTGIQKAPAYWSGEALMPGIVAIGPMLPGTLAFGMAFGALCAQKHFTLSEVEVMMACVYGGLSQFVAVQSWPETLTPSSIATLALLTLTVNIRFSLMSATLRPWFRNAPAYQAYPTLFMLGDGNWALALREQAQGRHDIAFLFGSAAAFDAPVRQTFVAELVGDKDLHNAVALNATSFNAARMIGPAVAGLTIAALSTGWAFREERRRIRRAQQDQ